ncbi:MAG TPA: papain-like cysteine protease family protein, partial [Planctomycetota bacterium]|nr:papain-like cysteine protease family protein [Planctomycetota bacterium]
EIPKHPNVPNSDAVQQALRVHSELFGEEVFVDVASGTYQLEPDVFLHLQAIPTLHVATTDAQTTASNRLSPRSDRCEISEGERGFSVLRLRDFASVEAEQETDSWCWAACVQMINAYRGVVLRERGQNGERSQQRIVADLYAKGREDEGKGMSTIWRALNPDLETRLQRESRTDLPIVLGLQWVVSDDIVESLLDGVPAVVGMQEGETSHAVVVTGATVAPLSNAWSGSFMESLSRRVLDTNWEGVHAYRIHSLSVFDPWKGVGERTITAEEFDLLATTIVAPRTGRAMMLRALKDQAGGGGLLVDPLKGLVPGSFRKD